jgi:glycosyltransferase involved in cell wall biosynthesis
MKIIRLTTFLDFGGIETKMANLATYSDINEWVFCAIGKGGVAEKKILSNNKEAVCFQLSHKIPSLKTIIKLYFYFKEQKPDVVHSSGAEANFHGVIAARLAGIPVIIAEEIGIPNHDRKVKKIFSWIYKLSHYVLGESQSVIDNLKNNYKIDSYKLKVVPNFTLFTKVETLKNVSKNNVFKLISVSRLEPVKNIEGIIRVLYRLKKEKFKIEYTIVGDGSSKDSLLALIEKLELQNEINLVGFQDNTEDYFLQSDLYVLNSLSEGFSNSLLEAMYMKKPSITTNVGAAQELIQNGSNGWIIKIDSEDELFENIKKCYLLDNNSRTIMGEKAYQTIIQNYSFQAHVKSLLTIYQSKL